MLITVYSVVYSLFEL